MPPLKHMEFWQKVHHGCVVRAGILDRWTFNQPHNTAYDEMMIFEVSTALLIGPSYDQFSQSVARPRADGAQEEPEPEPVSATRPFSSRSY